MHFLDDDLGGSNEFANLLHFLHWHYFPRLAWARLTLNPSKSELLGLRRIQYSRFKDTLESIVTIPSLPYDLLSCISLT